MDAYTRIQDTPLPTASAFRYTGALRFTRAAIEVERGFGGFMKNIHFFNLFPLFRQTIAKIVYRIPVDFYRISVKVTGFPIYAVFAFLFAFPSD